MSWQDFAEDFQKRHEGRKSATTPALYRHCLGKFGEFANPVLRYSAPWIRCKLDRARRLQDGVGLESRLSHVVKMAKRLKRAKSNSCKKARVRNIGGTRLAI